MSQNPTQRRGFLKWIAGSAGLFTLSRTAQAHHTPTHFGDTVSHKLVYQCNKADEEYLNHILFSVGEMLRKYGDDIWLVVGTFGPGLQILGKHPTRPISQEVRERVESLAAYGVHFHACGNTMKSLGWTKEDLVDFAEVVPIGVDDIMQLQEKGFAYMSW
jgi:intracellular sulfur oxidation DsrE/DsrF family protein